MKTKKKKLSQAKLLKKYEQLMKPIILDRDNNTCQIKGIGHTCFGSLRMDHRPAKRGKHATFFDPRNLTLVCGNANYMAELDPFVSDAILRAVVKREGDVIRQIYDESRVVKKWTPEEIELWIKLCAEYFNVNKSGLPDVQ